ncbi:MAG: Y-family DNA polymerase [Porticoccaceae bacterium]
MYALVDCNSFFASCEQIFRPELRHQPVVVLSNNDGCIVARSKEAKALDIPDLQPYFKVKSLLERHKVKVFSSNYELYGDISRRVVTVLREYAPALEVYSIDESFLLLDGCQFNWPEYGREIKETLWRDVRMPVCVGFAETKTLAKLANHIAKKSQKLQGVCVLDKLERWRTVFEKLPVNKVWGVGSRLSRRLAELGIHSVYDLQSADAKRIRRHFGVNLERTVAELNGVRCMNLDSQPQNKKQIYATRSFGQRVESQQGLEQAVSLYASRAAVKLRKQQSLVKTLLVFIQSSRFDADSYYNSATCQLPFASNDSGQIISAAKRLVAQLYKPGFAYAKAGVGLIELVDEAAGQLNFFDSYQSEKSAKLMALVDKLNSNGPQLFFASSGVNPSWQMQRRLKSPAYTTRLSDLPVVG